MDSDVYNSGVSSVNNSYETKSGKIIIESFFSKDKTLKDILFEYLLKQR